MDTCKSRSFGFDRKSKDSGHDRFCPKGDEDQHKCFTLCNTTDMPMS